MNMIDTHVIKIRFYGAVTHGNDPHGVFGDFSVIISFNNFFNKVKLHQSFLNISKKIPTSFKLPPI